MCNFLSGITFSDFLLPTRGRCHADPIKTDSHSELVRQLGLGDATSEGHFAKWEFSPTNDIADFDSYVFKLDEKRIPDWWTPEIEAETIEYAKSALRRVVLVTGTIDELRDDVYALAGNVTVKRLYSSVRKMRNASRVDVMLCSSRIDEMWNSSSIGVMTDSSSIGVMKCASRVDVMTDSSSVDDMWNSSRIDVMWGSSSIGEMSGSSQATLYSPQARATLGKNCTYSAMVIDRSVRPVKYHFAGKREKTIGSPRSN